MIHLRLDCGHTEDRQTFPDVPGVAFCVLCCASRSVVDRWESPTLFPETVDPDAVGGGAVSATATETSRHAAKVVKRGSQNAAILAALRQIGPAGAYRLASSAIVRRVRPGISSNQVGARLGELRASGFVRWVAGDRPGEYATEPAASGRARLHELTDAGRAEADRLNRIGER